MATKGSSKQRGGAAALLEEAPPAARTDRAQSATGPGSPGARFTGAGSAAAEPSLGAAPEAQERASEREASATPGAVSGSADLRASGIRQFVTFLSGGEVFAVDMEPVKEIIRVPTVVRVPLAPASLDGLANLRGRVLPIVSLRHLFGFAGQEHTEQTRALVVDVGQPLGFVVDRVSSVVGVEASRIEDVESIRTTVDTELLSGVIKNVGGHAMIMILDFARIVEREFASIAQLAKLGRSGAVGTGAGMSANPESTQEAVSDELQLVSFDLDGQEYAIAIQDVREIVQVPEEIVHVPRAESHVLGVMTLRSRLLPLVGLRRMFGLDDRLIDEKSRIVVLALDGATVGVVVDTVKEVLRVPKSAVDPLPALLARGGNLNEIAEICRLNDGKRLVSIVTVRQLFRQAAIREGIEETLSAMNAVETTSAAEAARGGEKLDDDEQVVVFRLDKEEFGAPIASVQEIVRVPEQLIRVPKAPGFVEGVINLRGSVLPVIDLRTRLGLQPVERSDGQRIMVFLIADVRTGFIVDQVAEVLRIPRASIEPAPELSGEQSRLLSRMANLGQQKRMVQLLDPPHLMGQKDLAALAKVAS